MARARDDIRGARRPALSAAKTDVAVNGGITALANAAHLAEAIHMNFEIHHGGNSLDNVANLRVMMPSESSVAP